MREIVLDTETTGLDPDQGHRIIEIGCVEVINYVPTTVMKQWYINPERTVDAAAEAVHGLGAEFLADKPLFAEIVEEFLDFLGEDRLVIHNAAFDMKFLNAEFARLGLPVLPAQRAVDTLVLAREKFPGSSVNLDALCRRYEIDNSARDLHGALLDAQLLAEVYLELRGGRQPDLVWDIEEEAPPRTEFSGGSFATADQKKGQKTAIKGGAKSRMPDGSYAESQAQNRHAPSDRQSDREAEGISHLPACASPPSATRPIRDFSPSAAELSQHQKLCEKLQNALWLQESA